MNTQKKIIEIQNLTIENKKNSFILLKSVNLNLFENEILTLLGESGSGKTTLALSLMGLLSKNLQTQGKLQFLDSRDSWVRGRDKTMVFQDPQVSLHPFFTIGFQLKEILNTHLNLKKKELTPYLLPRLIEVGLSNPHSILKAYPHQLSGGEKQRVLIAMALLCDPKLLIADEPTASLDLVIKVQILKLLLKLKEKRKFTLLLITHDIMSALRVSDRMVVLKRGKIIEEGDMSHYKRDPISPYTEALLNSRLSI